MLSVIIVSYNVKFYLEQCLESVRRASRGLRVEVFVVDNLSVDGSVAYLRERFPEDIHGHQSSAQFLHGIKPFINFFFYSKRLLNKAPQHAPAHCR